MSLVLIFGLLKKLYLFIQNKGIPMLTDYLKILGLTDDDAAKIIDEMEGERAKEILKVVVAIWNEEKK